MAQLSKRIRRNRLVLAALAVCGLGILMLSQGGQVGSVGVDVVVLAGAVVVAILGERLNHRRAR